MVVEPSAGNGAFSSKIPNCVAIDIEPEANEIQKADFLSWLPDKIINNNKVLVIGNPPFGRQSSMAIKFIKHACKFADTIAFVLPKSFKKPSLQNKIPEMFHLTRQIDLEINSFTLNGSEYDVPCVFQVWRKGDIAREKQKKQSLPGKLSWVKNPTKADIAIRRVGVNAGTAFMCVENKSVQSHYFLSCEDKASVSKIVEHLNKYSWEHNNTTGPRSISKNEFIELLTIIMDIK